MAARLAVGEATYLQDTTVRLRGEIYEVTEQNRSYRTVRYIRK